MPDTYPTPAIQTPLPTWLRAALGATAAMNLLGAFAFLPAFGVVRHQMGFPTAVHPLYLWIISEFIFLFGLAYGWCALTGQAPRLFVALAAAGKLVFFATLLGFWLSGDLPALAVLGGTGDLLFGCLFLGWLLGPSRTR